MVSVWFTLVPFILLTGLLASLLIIGLLAEFVLNYLAALSIPHWTCVGFDPAVLTDASIVDS
jgi:hypothetical protein